MKKAFLLLFTLIIAGTASHAQLVWKNVDSAYGPLPEGVHLYRTESLLDGKPNIAFYLEADLKNRDIEFSADTTLGRRLTPDQFYGRNEPALAVVNTTFFSFATNQNLNAVIRRGELVSHNVHSLPGKGIDTLTWRHPIGAVFGLSRKRNADIAWVYSDSSKKYPLAYQRVQPLIKDSLRTFQPAKRGKKWKMETAVGGGPVLVQNGQRYITNEQEWRFAGKGLTDKHPRTAIGYTTDSKLIILVVEGRNAGKAEGASLSQLSDMLVQIGCEEAMNLDGGGSSCLLVNGKETIWPSDKGKQRPVPAVFVIRHRVVNTY